MSKSAKDFEEFARDCVRLAEQADTPALREKLLGLAREWMQALMDVEDAEALAGNFSSRPFGRQPAELASAYVMLAEPISSYVSGATIAVTGGRPIL